MRRVYFDVRGEVRFYLTEQDPLEIEEAQRQAFELMQKMHYEDVELKEVRITEIKDI